MHSTISISIQTKIARAERIYSAYAGRILQDQFLLELVSAYRTAIRNSADVMAETGVVTLCGACAAKDPGGCCAEGVEDWYDEWLLLANLLMGAGVDHTREISDGCLFVGSRGCKLVARHSFCVNFLCPSIKDFLPATEVRRLSAVSGTELSAGWVLEQELRRWLGEDISPADEVIPL